MSNKENLINKEKITKQNRVWVRIASACNNKCIFCLDYFAQDWSFVDEEIVKKEIKNWYKKNEKNKIILSGWEATINPKFIEYIKYAKELWYQKIQTITNWNMYANEIFCKNVFEAWLWEVTFSFHWHNETLHDYLVSTKWAFKKSLKALIFIKKNYPEIIVNIDIVVNKINIKFLPEIVKFFMRFWVYEYDILQIIPFWKWFSENKDKLFYDIEKNINFLQETWKLSKIPWMYMWTNRFPAEAFEWFEELIQDPRKINSEVMWEGRHHFEPFILTNWEKKQDCYPLACDVCFLNQYCNDFIKNQNTEKLKLDKNFEIIRWEEFLSEIYKKYWNTKNDFLNYLDEKIKAWKSLINIPKCLGGTWIYETYNDVKDENSIEDYTEKYINNLYRKKSIKCKKCKYFKNCEGIHINFIRAYSFSILKPIN